MRFIHTEPINAEFLEVDHALPVLFSFLLQFFQLCLETLLLFLKLTDAVRLVP